MWFISHLVYSAHLMSAFTSTLWVVRRMFSEILCGRDKERNLLVTVSPSQMVQQSMFRENLCTCDTSCLFEGTQRKTKYPKKINLKAQQ